MGAALYAGYLRPELRATAGQMSYLSFMTDDVARGKVDEPYFRRSVVWLTGSRIAGTMLAQVLLVPSAMWIVTVAEWL